MRQGKRIQWTFCGLEFKGVLGQDQELFLAPKRYVLHTVWSHRFDSNPCYRPPSDLPVLLPQWRAFASFPRRALSEQDPVDA